jgi:hypothetical protein
MLFCYVITGESFPTTAAAQSFKEPPNREDGQPYDSVKGIVGGPNHYTYVIYDNCK